MKFVHIADMHFDTSFAQINDNELGNSRRLEQRKAFKKVIEYIKENNVDYLFIAGDFYEHKYIRESTIEFINKLFKEIENTKVFITPGNHDPLIKNSFYSKYNWNKNVYIFDSKISCISDSEVNIYGYGFDDFYYKNPAINEFVLEDKSKTNILITHGSLDGGYDDERVYNPMFSSKVRQLGFDYIALGHIHKSNYTESENVVYPGSTISMGFDELGSHGMVVGEIIDKKLKTKFIPLDEGEFKIYDLDISELESIETIADTINDLMLDSNKFYEITLTGNRNFEIDIYNLKKMIVQHNVIKIKDKTKLAYNLEEMAQNNTLKGLFVKKILERLNDGEYDRETVEKALEIGLEILEK
ncbi:MAG: DNA repair exonuclease [Clostridia bacterium]|nr:DNA repair exonuclease [Clostridia bacterium]